MPECVGGPGLVLRGPGDMGGLPHGQVWSGAWSKRAPIAWVWGVGILAWAGFLKALLL